MPAAMATPTANTRSEPLPGVAGGPLVVAGGASGTGDGSGPPTRAEDSLAASGGGSEGNFRVAGPWVPGAAPRALDGGGALDGEEPRSDPS